MDGPGTGASSGYADVPTRAQIEAARVTKLMEQLEGSRPGERRAPVR